jgi:hypothetical protein
MLKLYEDSNSVSVPVSSCSLFSLALSLYLFFLSASLLTYSPSLARDVYPCEYHF